MDLKDTDMMLVAAGEYTSLQEDSRMLQCLHDAGVDNWSGYSYAMEAFNNGDAQ